MDDSIISEVKNYLNITWQDDETDKNITNIAKRARSVLENYAGSDIDLSDGFVNQLFLDCCRYIYNHCYEDYERNFESDLFYLRQSVKIKEMNRSAE